MYRLWCDPSSRARLVGSPSLVCDGERYNDTIPLCLTGPTTLHLTGPHTLQVGQEVSFTIKKSLSGRVGWKIMPEEENLNLRVNASVLEQVMNRIR